MLVIDKSALAHLRRNILSGDIELTELAEMILGEAAVAAIRKELAKKAREN